MKKLLVVLQILLASVTVNVAGAAPAAADDAAYITTAIATFTGTAKYRSATRTFEAHSTDCRIAGLIGPTPFLGGCQFDMPPVTALISANCTGGGVGPSFLEINVAGIANPTLGYDPTTVTLVEGDGLGEGVSSGVYVSDVTFAFVFPGTCVEGTVDAIMTGRAAIAMPPPPVTF